MTVDLTDPIFHDDAKAREWLEASRWPSGPSCPHCGSFGVLRMEGKAHRPGLFHCRDCRGQFTVLTGSVMESSHIPLPKWVLAIRLMTSSKKGISAHQLHRTLGITYKSAWIMAHRIREAMADPAPTPIGGEGKVIEADEAYHGKRKTAPEPQRHDKYRTKPTKRGLGGGAQKRPIVALVERGGEARVMSAAPKTYEIRTVDDFFKVPPDRRDVCLKEFAAWLAASDFMIALVEETGIQLERPDLFEWIDDEKGEFSISIDDGREKTTIFRGHVK